MILEKEWECEGSYWFTESTTIWTQSPNSQIPKFAASMFHVAATNS